MSFILISQVLTIAVAVILAFWWRRARKKPLSNVTTVSILALVALLDLEGSHFATYIKITAALLVALMWVVVYRYREEGPVMGAILVGLAAIMILSG